MDEQTPEKNDDSQTPMENVETQAGTKIPPQLFTIKNSSRSPHTKAQRKASAGPNRTKQYVGGGELRIVRGTGTRVTEGTLRKHLREVVEKVTRGELQVMAPNGQLIALSDLKRGLEFDQVNSIPLPPNPVAAPLPNPPMDSAKNDLPGGQDQVPIYPGGDPAIVDPNKKPELVAEASRDEEHSPIVEGGPLPPNATLPTDPPPSNVPQGLDEDHWEEPTLENSGTPSLMGGGGGGGHKNKKKNR